MNQELIIGGRRCQMFGSEQPACILVQPSARHENPTLEAEAQEMEKLVKVPFVLVTIELEDWMLELMPWADGNISRDPEAGKHAQDTLDYILTSLIPELEQRFNQLPVILGGYSLGGLFALWASMQTGRFKAIAAASPSVWIRDWVPYAQKHTPMAENIYLSLGNKEAHVKNQAIARVGDSLNNQYLLLQKQLGTNHCILFLEEGGHFADNAGRLARAFAWCIKSSLSV